MALPCFDKQDGAPHPVDEDACLQVRLNYTLPGFRADVPGAVMNPQDDACFSLPDNQCLLDNTVIPAALPASNSSCNQGNLAPYILAVQNASDIAAAFEFARAHRVPISVKNSGHDYMIRNAQPGSLTLWMHHIQHMTYDATFTPDGCPASVSYGPVLTIGTGVSSDAATAFATAHNATLLVGSSPTVPPSGGWVLGGGHSVLSPAYGLGVDRVVQFTVVTPDGVARVASACHNEDLFWALRGGGGGTFGVVLDATHRVERAPLPVAVASLALPADVASEVAMEWIALQAREGLGWGRAGWGGHGSGTYLTYVNPLPRFANPSDEGASAAVGSMRSAVDFVEAHGGTSVIEVLPSWSDVWAKYIKPASLTIGGGFVVVGDRLWPQRLFETDKGLEAMLGYVRTLVDRGADPRSAYVKFDSPFVVPGASEGYDTNTSAHPAWYSSLWNYGSVSKLAWNSSYDDRLRAMADLTELDVLAGEVIGPGSGAYMHEANPFTPEWQDSFWGSNYARLLRIKNKYDPDRLLRCWKCVGFRDSDVESDSFKCQRRLQTDVNAVLSVDRL